MDNNIINTDEYNDLNEVDELLNEETVIEGVHLEDHTFSGQQNTQQLDFTTLLQDTEAFQNVFFPPTSEDDSLMNANEYIDFDELHDLLNNEKVNEGSVHFVVGNEGGFNASHGSNMVATQINNGELMKVKRKDEQNVKNWPTRKRIEKGSVHDAQRKELHKIRNRESAARAFAQKKAYIKELEQEVQKFRKKNAYLREMIQSQFLESSLSKDMSREKLKRTASGPM